MVNPYLAAMRRGYTPAWGAQVCEGGVRFRLWAPGAKSVACVLFDGTERLVPMTASGNGWHESIEASARTGTRYLYEIDGELRVADPASRFQPEGPEQPSEVVDPFGFDWPEEQHRVGPLTSAVIYELHVGAFTLEGTYEAAARHLPEIADLGVTAVEVMPLSQAPGSRNWGYDGVLHYAPNHCYGRPDDLKRFIVQAHANGLAVLLDVVYNHFGPQGNYLSRYAPQFFNDRIRTPWGSGIDYSSPANDPVRAYAIDNACYWIAEYGFDGLRLDAVPMIVDSRPHHILDELCGRAREVAGKPIYLIAEDVKNELPPERLNAFDCRWSDDLHHSLHVAITGERGEYFGAFTDAPIESLGKALVSSTRRVAYLQNHDQIGNRPFGERIAQLAPEAAVRVAVAIVLLAPHVPLLFMGEEWAASTPFLFFCDFEPKLEKRIAQGRRSEFAGLAEFQDPNAPPIPDPGSPLTFERSKLRRQERPLELHPGWLTFYGELMRIRSALAERLRGAEPIDSPGYDLVGNAGLTARWRLSNGTCFRLETNLSKHAQGGFMPARANLIFSTPGFDADIAPAWSVRWSFGE